MDTSVHFTPLKICKALGALRHLHKHPRLQLCGFAVARRTFIFMWRRGTWCLGFGRGILHQGPTCCTLGYCTRKRDPSVWDEQGVYPASSGRAAV